jgi:DNA-binding NtrC family response regulator
MKPTVLFLDDDQNRHNLFYKWMHNICQTTHVKTSLSAIKTLKHQKFDVVCLDFDLGDFGNVEGGDGLEVAEFMSLHMEIKDLPKLTIIHSHNPQGAMLMRQYLIPTSAIVLSSPFGLDMIKLLKDTIKDLDF